MWRKFVLELRPVCCVHYAFDRIWFVFNLSLLHDPFFFHQITCWLFVPALHTRMFHNCKDPR